MRTARWYQDEAADAFYKYYNVQRRRRAPLWSMATGTGKTFTAHLVVNLYATWGLSVLWIAPRRELVTQASKYLEEDVESGFVLAGKGHAPGAQIVYAGIDTLRARIDRIQDRYDLVVVDEAHMFTDEMMALAKHFMADDGYMLGLTATPERADGNMEQHWEIVYSFSLMDALKAGFLLWPYACVTKPPKLDLSRVGIGPGGEFLSGEVEQELARAHIVEHTVETILRGGHGQRLPLKDEGEMFHPLAMGGGIVFCASINQAQRTVDMLDHEGVRAAIITGKTPKAERAHRLELFESGHLDVLVNVGTLTTGTDLPRANWCVIARPTRSHPLFIQMIGRILRLHEDQDKACIFDLVGCTDFHHLAVAPVLVCGRDCEDSPDGSHRYLPLDTGEGRCKHCLGLIKCYASRGGHDFLNGVCRKCGSTQCPETGGMHEWVDWELGTRACCLCGVEMADPVTSMLTSRPPPKEPVEWVEIPIPHQQIHASYLANDGILFVVKKDDELFRPLWWYNKRVFPLSRDWVDRDTTVALCSSVARRSKKVRKKYGGFAKKSDRTKAVTRGQIVATQHRIWEI